MKKEKVQRKTVVESGKGKKMVPSLPYVELTLSTWIKDSHGLYDYEAHPSKYERETVKIRESCKIYRNPSTLRIKIVEIDDDKQMPLEEIYLATVIIDRHRGVYKVQSAAVSGVQPHPIIKEDHPNLFHNCYLVLRQFEKEIDKPGYPLVPGNIIKLGRVEYLVLETKNDQVQTFHTSHLQLNTANHVVENSLTGTCKVCLCDDNSEEDPLISPCVCKGSCQLIHVSCLKNWINSKVKMEYQELVTTFNFSQFQCQICKAPLPKTITHPKGNSEHMINISKPPRPYVVLESLGEKENKKQRNLYVASPIQGLPLKIGRGHQCEIRINDISVSRTHGEIRLEDGKFYLSDLKSKFGTLIKFKQQFEIKDKLSFQYGRMCLNFKLITQPPKQESETSEDDDLYHQ